MVQIYNNDGNLSTESGGMTRLYRTILCVAGGGYTNDRI